MANSAYQPLKYLPGSAQLPQAIPFSFLVPADLDAVQILTNGDVESLGLDVDYSVSGDYRNGEGIFQPLRDFDADVAVRVRRSTESTQPEVLLPHQPVPAKSLTDGLDRQSMIVQEVDARVTDLKSRTIVVPDGEFVPELPRARFRTGPFRYLGFNPNDGTPQIMTLSETFKGDPGGNVMAIGSFEAAPGLNIPEGTNLVHTSSYAPPLEGKASGIGAARYAYDPAVDEDYVFNHPRSSFISLNERGFKLVEPVVSVMMFGAIGDGDFDDTPALVAALAHCAEMDINLHLSAGTYSIAGIGAAEFTGRISLIGTEPGVTLKGSLPWPMAFAPDLATNCFFLDGVTSVQAENITFANMGAVFRYGTNYGEHELGDFVIRNCRFEQCYCPLAHYNNLNILSWGDIVFEGNAVKDCQTGLDWYGRADRARIVNNIFVNLHRTVFEGASMWGRCAAANLSTPYDSEDATISTGEIIVANNIVVNVQSDWDDDVVSGHCDANGFLMQANMVLIEGNIVQEVTNATKRNVEALYARGRNVVVNGNTCFNAGLFQAAIAVKNPDLPNFRTIVSNNIVEVTDEYKATAADVFGTCGLRVESGTPTTITGNKFINTVNGIDIGGFSSYSLEISGNEIQADNQGIIVYPTQRQLIIRDNVLIISGLATYTGVNTSFGVNITNYPNEDIEKSDIIIEGNSLEFLSDDEMGGARGFLFRRNGDYGMISVFNNIIKMNSENSNKIAVSMAATNIVDASNGTIEYFKIHRNAFLPLTLSVSQCITAVLTSMGGWVDIEGNTAFVTENQGEFTWTNSLEDVLHGLSYWNSITGVEQPNPYKHNISLTFGSLLNGASYSYIESTASTSFRARLDTAPSSNVTGLFVARRNKEFIA